MRYRYWPSWWGLVGWAVVWVGGSGFAIWTKLFSKRPLITKPVAVEIAAPDSLALLNVPGFLPGRIHRLMEAIRALGPLRSWEEVQEVLGDSVFMLASPWLKGSFPPDTFPTLDLNAVDSATLVKYQYCRPVRAGRVIRYRYKAKGFLGWGDLDSLRGLWGLERYRLRRYGRLGQRAMGAADRRKPVPVLDLNTTSVEELEGLPGIGPKTAERIVRYREKLGYYVSLDQLREVWGLREENLQKALPYLRIGRRGAPLSLREASVEELARHPYISWRLAKALVRARAYWKEKPIPPEVWRSWLPDTIRSRLEPYLTGE